MELHWQMCTSILKYTSALQIHFPRGKIQQIDQSRHSEQTCSGFLGFEKMYPEGRVMKPHPGKWEEAQE